MISTNFMKHKQKVSPANFIQKEQYRFLRNRLCRNHVFAANSAGEHNISHIVVRYKK